MDAKRFFRTGALLIAFMLLSVIIWPGKTPVARADESTPTAPPSYGLGVSPDVEAWENEQAQANAQIGLASVSAPAMWDWRSVYGHDYTTSVKDQGHCGACVGFALAGTMEADYKVYQHSYNLNPDLSEAETYFCVGQPDSCSDGMSVSAAYNAAVDQGVVDEQCFPYSDEMHSCNLCSDAAARALHLSNWRGTTDVAEAKYIIANFGPVTATMKVYEDFYSYTSGVYEHTSGSYRGGHAVTIVGYDDSGQYWIVKNSWGTGWGEDGYFRIKYGECEIDNYFYIPEFSKSHLGVYFPGSGMFMLKTSLGGVIRHAWFGKNGRPIAGDWNNDGKEDLGVYDPNTGVVVLKTSYGTFLRKIYFSTGGYPIVADWNGDGKDDIGVYFPDTGMFMLKTSYGTVIRHVWFGKNGRPIVGDWNQDGKEDLGVYDTTTGATVLKTSYGTFLRKFYFGTGGEPVTGDWNSDGKDDIGVYFPNTGMFMLKTSYGTLVRVVWFGKNGHPVVGDWKLQNRTDLGVYYSSGQFVLKTMYGTYLRSVYFAAGGIPVVGHW